MHVLATSVSLEEIAGNRYLTFSMGDGSAVSPSTRVCVLINDESKKRITDMMEGKDNAWDNPR